jgi:outer membrane protein TolC
MKSLLFAMSFVCAVTDVNAQPPSSVPASRVPASQSGPPLELGALHRAAEAADPRVREVELLQQQWVLRDQNVSVLRRPSLGVESLGQYQSDVPVSPFLSPTGIPLFEAPKATFDSYLRVEQRLFDPTLTPQAALQRAQLAEDQARVHSAVYPIRQQVNDAFFAVAALDQRVGVLTAASAELDARLRETAARVREGTAVPAEAAAIEASLLQRQQEEDELRTNRGAAVTRLSLVVGRPIESTAVPVLPDLSDVARRAREQGTSTKTRPEFAQFARTRERLQRQRDAVVTQTQPRLTAYGRVGYARPGLNFIADEFDTYGLGGIRLQWNAWSWGTPTREAQLVTLQADIVSAEEAAFVRGLDQAVATDVATIDRLERALTTDSRIIELRAEVERAARVRLQEGVLTAADYVARESELLQARFAQASHQVELAQARARLLTTLGVEVP